MTAPFPTSSGRIARRVDTSFDRRAIPKEAVESSWTAPDGHAIRRIDWLLPQGAHRGSLLFMPGRGDAYEKYIETLDYWHRQGWRVTAMDWRGQAGSGRLGRDPLTGHVDDFVTWVDDLGAFWTQWRRTTSGPHVLAAHSMGGHVALRALAERRVDPDAMVLTAPMLGFNGLGLPASFLHQVARFMASLGDRRRPAWKWSEKPGAFPKDRSDLLTHDAERYADEVWWREKRPELVMGPASWGWLERALASVRVLERPGLLEAVGTPVLMLAMKRDGLVAYGPIDRAAHRLPRGQLVSFGTESRHEILREEDGVRDRALALIDEFLDRVAARAD